MGGFFSGLAQNLGLASDYHATPGAVDPSKGFTGGANAQEDTSQYGQKSGAAFGSGDNYQSGAIDSLNDPRIGADYARAAGQVTAPTYNGGYARLLNQQMTDQAQRAQSSMAASANPNNAGLASYEAMNNAAGLQAAGAGNAALQEQQMKAQYDQMKANTDLQNRQQNLGLLGESQQNAQYGAGLNANLAGQQYGNAQWYGNQQLSADQLAQQGQETNAGITAGNQNAANSINAGVAQNAASAGAGILGAAASGVAGAATGGISLLAPGGKPPGVSSDVRGKAFAVSEGTKSAPGFASQVGTDHRSLADEFLASLHPYSFEYRDPENEPREQPNGGRYLGVMAQDVERAPGVGRQIVSDGPNGKRLEGPALVSGLAAGVGRLHERLAALEAKRGGR